MAIERFVATVVADVVSDAFALEERLNVFSRGKEPEVNLGIGREATPGAPPGSGHVDLHIEVKSVGVMANLRPLMEEAAKKRVKLTHVDGKDKGRVVLDKVMMYMLRDGVRVGVFCTYLGYYLLIISHLNHLLVSPFIPYTSTSPFYTVKELIFALLASSNSKLAVNLPLFAYEGSEDEEEAGGSGMNDGSAPSADRRRRRGEREDREGEGGGEGEREGSRASKVARTRGADADLGGSAGRQNSLAHRIEQSVPVEVKDGQSLDKIDIITLLYLGDELGNYTSTSAVPSPPTSSSTPSHFTTTTMQPASTSLPLSPPRSSASPQIDAAPHLPISHSSTLPDSPPQDLRRAIINLQRDFHLNGLVGTYFSVGETIVVKLEDRDGSDDGEGEEGETGLKKEAENYAALKLFQGSKIPVFHGYYVDKETGASIIIIQHVGQSMDELYGRRWEDIDTAMRRNVFNVMESFLRSGWEHDDLEPRNVCETKNGELRVIDLGMMSTVGEEELEEAFERSRKVLAL